MLGLMLPLEGLKIAGNPDIQGVFQNFMLGLAKKHSSSKILVHLLLAGQSFRVCEQPFE